MYLLVKSVGQGIQWAAKPFLQCVAHTNHSHFRSDLTADLCWYQWASMQKSHEKFEGRIYLIEHEISPCLIFNVVIGQEKGLFCIWAGILEDAHVLTPQNPYHVCIQSELRLLQLTNSACLSSITLGLFLQNTVNLLIHPTLTVPHGCGGCWQGTVCHTRPKDHGHSPHHH